MLVLVLSTCVIYAAKAYYGLDQQLPLWTYTKLAQMEVYLPKESWPNQTWE